MLRVFYVTDAWCIRDLVPYSSIASLLVSQVWTDLYRALSQGPEPELTPESTILRQNISGSNQQNIRDEWRCGIKNALDELTIRCPSVGVDNQMSECRSSTLKVSQWVAADCGGWQGWVLSIPSPPVQAAFSFPHYAGAVGAKIFFMTSYF